MISEKKGIPPNKEQNQTKAVKHNVAHIWILFTVADSYKWTED